MPSTDMWNDLAPADWAQFAHSWLAEIRTNPPSQEEDLRSKVVLMNFTATPAQQWTFIQAAIEAAQSDDELGHIAAGPLEHILGFHGNDFISAAEEYARVSPSFARALTGMYQFKMSDEVWGRVQAACKDVNDPL